MLSLELCRPHSDIFFSGRPRDALATAYITGYGCGPIGQYEEHTHVGTLKRERDPAARHGG